MSKEAQFICKHCAHTVSGFLSEPNFCGHPSVQAPYGLRCADKGAPEACPLKHTNSNPVLHLLNSMLQADPESTTKLTESRVECNEAMADLPHLQVSGSNPSRVGVLGCVNGVLSALDLPKIMGVFEEGTLVRFEEYKEQL